jgi:hypothetical protein
MRNFDEAYCESITRRRRAALQDSLGVRRGLSIYALLRPDGTAHERTSAQCKPPRQIRRAADADAFVGNNIELPGRTGDKAMARVRAQVHLMIPAGNSERLCDLAWTGAKLAEILNPATSLHQFNPSPRFERANQHKPVRDALYQHIQHPVNTVVEINVRRPRFIVFDKVARTRTRKGVGSFVIDCRIRFYLDDDPGALPPNQFSADQCTRTGNRIASEERRANKLVLQASYPVLVRTAIKTRACSKPEFSHWIQPVDRYGMRG